MRCRTPAVHGLWVSLLLAASFAPLAGCSWCEFDFAGVCVPESILDAQYSTVTLARNGKDDLVMYFIQPPAPNGTGVLVAHGTSEDTKLAAAESAVGWAKRFLDEGYTIIAHAYEENDSAYGQHDLEDTLDAIAYLGGAAGKARGIEKLFLAGTSRGGIIAYQTSYRVQHGVLAGIIADRGVSNFLILPLNLNAIDQGVLGPLIREAVLQTVEWLGGVVPEQDPEPWKALSAGYNIDRIETPMLILHGSWDILVPFNQALDFRDRAVEAGRDDFTFVLIEGKGHFNLADDPRFDEAIIEFINSH